MAPEDASRGHETVSIRSVSIKPLFTLLAALSATMLMAPALADDVWAGVYRHDVLRRGEPQYQGGTDLKAGWIGRPIEGLHAIGSPSPHAIVSAHLEPGRNDYVAAGLDWTFGSVLYVRPGIGIAVNDGRRPDYRNGVRMDLGSPITFEPELALGVRLTNALRVEASYIHLSHLWLFSRQNRGLDSVGIRTLVRFG
jgi:hypothetical protein